MVTTATICWLTIRSLERSFWLRPGHWVVVHRDRAAARAARADWSVDAALAHCRGRSERRRPHGRHLVRSAHGSRIPLLYDVAGRVRLPARRLGARRLVHRQT